MAIPRDDGLRRSDFDNPSLNKHRKGRFVVTAACAGAPVSTPFLRSLENYCAKNNAKLIILPMRAHVRPAEGQPEYFDEALYPYIERGQVVSEYQFNENLRAADFYLNPQQLETLTGLERFTDTSLIVAHTKQFLTHHAVGNNGVPRSVHSTGVCTLPDYVTNRMGALADRDHTIGALVVEISGGHFYQRQLCADKNGSVIDLGTRYFADGKTRDEQATVLVLGDVHAGQHCEKAFAFAAELSALLRPKHTVVHDLFNGISISHHVLRRKLERMKVPSEVNTLAKEFAVTAGVLAEIQSWSGSKVCVVASNHNDWLSRYLNETDRWAYDEPNIVLAAELFAKVARGQIDEPLQHMVDPAKKCLWWDRETDFRVDGVQLACHGDLGTNGAKGSAGQIEKAHGNATCGHTHSASIHRGVYHAGHSTHPRHGYNKGASTWTQSHVVQYAGGQRQIITLIDGAWRA